MKLIFILLASVCIANSTYAQTTWYVDAAQADNSGAGTSWITAEKELQVAINEAASGDQIWVKAGTYKPTLGTDRNATISLKNGVSVYGGFAGTETLLFQRNDIYNITILSGDLLGNDVGFTNNGDNSIHVVKCYDAGSTTTLDGFTITKGNSSGYGGGLDFSNSSAVLNNLVFSTNYAYLGGGAATFYLGSPVITNCVFDNNVTPNAGSALDFYTLSSVKITNSIFYNNTSGYYGTFSFDGCGSVTVNNCTIAKNHFSGSPNVAGNSNIGWLNYSDVRWDPLESTCRHASLSIL